MPNASTATPDLMGLVNRQFTPDVIQRAASELGEDRERTARAVSTSVPSVLTALSDVASSPAGANHLEEVLEETRRTTAGRTDGGPPLGSRSSVEAGTRVFDNELGAKSSSIADAVAGSSGIRPDSAHKLLGGVTSATLAMLSKNMMGASTLRTASHDQRGEWVRRLPGPVAALFGASGYGAAKATTPAVERASTGPAIRTLPAPRRNWLLPLAVVAIAILGYALARGFRRPTVEHMRPTATQTFPRAAAPAARVPITLPNGQTLSVARGSGVDQLATYLGSSDATVPKRFTLSPMNFESTTANLTPESLSTVNDLAAVLRAYPTAAVTVASFTDNTGSPDTNLSLSTSRSEAIRSLLAARGVSTSRINAVGFGQEHPVASNDTAQGRAANARAEVVVTNK
jgi:outer membrane protein OmpA-like peptidoglycan-associated protein